MVDAKVSTKKRRPCGPPLPVSAWPSLLDRDQIDRCGLAAAVDLELELDPGAPPQGHQAGPLHRRNMDEGVGLAVVAGDEAEALGRVEELDRARSLLAGQFALRAAAAAVD